MKRKRTSYIVFKNSFFFLVCNLEKTFKKKSSGAVSKHPRKQRQKGPSSPKKRHLSLSLSITHAGPSAGLSTGSPSLCFCYLPLLAARPSARL